MLRTEWSLIETMRLESFPEVDFSLFRFFIPIHILSMQQFISMNQYRCTSQIEAANCSQLYINPYCNSIYSIVQQPLRTKPRQISVITYPTN